MATKFIVDISTFQRSIDYKKLKSAVDGVIIRVGYRGYGKAGSLATDAYFKNHITNCIKHGTPVGVYWFAQEITKAEGVEAANYVHSLIKGYKHDLPVYYDSEGSTAPNNTGRADRISKTARTDATVGFCEQIKKLGYIPGVYASESWFNTHLDFNRIKGYSIWVACYGSNTGKAGRKPNTPVYDMWQFSSKGRVDGYNGNLDVNYCYKDFGAKVDAKPVTKPVAKPAKKPATTVKTNVVEEWQKAAIKDGFSFPKYGADGDWGAECEAVARKAICKVYSSYKYKNLTKIIQKAVGVTADGLYGSNTKRAVIAYQKKNGLVADGAVGINTWKKILGVK